LHTLVQVRVAPKEGVKKVQANTMSEKRVGITDRELKVYLYCESWHIFKISGLQMVNREAWFEYRSD